MFVWALDHQHEGQIQGDDWQVWQLGAENKRTHQRKTIHWKEVKITLSFKFIFHNHQMKNVGLFTESVHSRPDKITITGLLQLTKIIKKVIIWNKIHKQNKITPFLLFYSASRQGNIYRVHLIQIMY